MEKQTAVEWLEQEFVKLESTIGVHGIMYELIEQAKDREKQQIIEAYKYGNQSDVYFKPEQYYNETSPITPEALIELGFVKKLPFYELQIEDRELAVHRKHLTVYIEWISTNATTVEDIKHLIRLFS